MQVQERKLSQIRPYEKNPRKNDKAVDLVANSIREFGWKQPIVIDSDGVIVAGHTRFKAAQKLGLESAPCVVADDLSPEQIKAYRLADNKTNEAAEWDFGLLDLELDGIEGIDMTQFGFEFEDEPQEVREDDFDEDSVPKAEPKAKRGDIYQLGEHRLMCGDSASAEDVQLLMGGGTGGHDVHRPALWSGDRRQE